jgi:hypothetical protein
VHVLPPLEVVSAWIPRKQHLKILRESPDLRIPNVLRETRLVGMVWRLIIHHADVPPSRSKTNNHPVFGWPLQRRWTPTSSQHPAMDDDCIKYWSWNRVACFAGSHLRTVRITWRPVKGKILCWASRLVIFECESRREVLNSVGQSHG